MPEIRTVLLQELGSFDTMSDEEVIARVHAGEIMLFEIVMRRYNQRIYRVARTILRDDAEAEDVMQDAYVRAYQHLAQFEGRAKFSTWLTKIAVHEALARARRRKRFDRIHAFPAPDGESMNTFESKDRDPERQAFDHEMNILLEKAVDALPANYRCVFMMREIEGMSTAETAECLEISEESVKVRLHRAKAVLRRRLSASMGTAIARGFQFHRSRCDRVVTAVFARIATQESR
ncbi:MAG TPA: RNA polymerase sigma factor [Acidobacteriota bacterium]|jgi:RNA polymerase sigma-70 factor (ECF subfamily)